MGARIAWTAGGDAELVAIEEDRTTWSSSRAWPPGSRPDGALEDGARVWIKVHGSQRTPDGRFRVAGRLLDATRELRARLVASLGDGSRGESENRS